MNTEPQGTTNIDERLCVFWNVSLGKSNYSQRNNKFSYKKNNRCINWTNECNVTSIVRSLDYNGFIFPKGDFAQPEDNLAQHMVKSKIVDSKYKSRFPALYEEWAKGTADCYSPLEIHKLLEIGVNDWFGFKVDTFNDSTPIKSIKQQLIDYSKSVVISGQFGKLGHIVSLVGIAYDKSLYLKCCEENLDICDFEPIGYFYDDSWGTFNIETKTYDVSRLGNDMWLSNENFIGMMKPVGNTKFKYAHIFEKPVSLI